MSLEVTCLNRSIHDAQCDIEGGDTNVTSGINIYDNVNLTTRFLYSPVYATFGDTVAYLFDLRGNKISISYSDLDGIDRSDLETLLEDCGCCGSGSDYLEVNNTPIGYIPTLSGNVTNLNEVVIDSVGTKWIIDVLGNATQLGTGANVKWSDKLVAFGHTATGGLFYQSDFIFDYTTSSLTIGDRDTGIEGLNTVSIGSLNTAENQYSLVVGNANLTNSQYSAIIGRSNSVIGNYNTVLGRGNTVNGSSTNIFGQTNVGGNSSNIFGFFLDTNGFDGNAMFSDGIGGSLAIADDAFTAQFAGGYRFRLDASSTAVNISSTGIVTIDNVVNNNAETQLLVWNVTTKEVEYRTASSLPFGSGTVTAVNSGAGMDFANFTTSGTIILGTPSSITLSSTNAATGTTHSHEFDLGGTAGQYLAGDTTLQTFPTIPVALWADKRLAFGQTAAGGLTYDSYLQYDYTTLSLTIGTRSAGTEGLYSAVIGITNLNSDNYTFQIGDQLSNTSGAGNLNVGNDNVLTSAFFSSVIGNHIDYSGSNSIIGGSLQNVVGSNNNITGSSHTVAGGNNLVSGIEHTVNGSAITALGYYTNITHDGVTVLSDLNYTGVTSSTATNQFIGRFLNGYVFKLTASSTAVAINSSGQIVANFVPSSPSSTDIIVRGGGNILSYRTVSSLPFTNNTGTVTNFSANDLTTGYTYPLFTVNVTNPTTTPDLTFSLPSLPQKFVFAAPWGVTGTPLWRQLLPSDLQADGASTGQVITWNGTQWTPQTPTGGGVTSVSAGNGMNFTTITTTGAVTMGTPSNITLASTNSATGTTHSHAFVPGGSATTQYVTGSGTLATNLWTAYGGYLMPTGGNAVRTNNTGGHGYILLEKGNASNSGNLQIYNTSARVGYIGNELSYMNYTAETGNHRFYGNNVYLDVIPSQPTGAYLLCTTTAGSGIISYRNVSALTGLPSSVWYLQGGTTASTNTSQNIYRTGDVWLNTGSTGAGGYKFRVTGDSYFEAQQYFAYATYQVWRNSANNAWLNGIRYNTANQLELGQSGFDALLAGYTSARNGGGNDALTILTNKHLFVNTSGIVQSSDMEDVVNDSASVNIVSTESHPADSTPRRVTFDSFTNGGSRYTQDFTSGDLKILLPTKSQYHKITVTLEYTTSGTPTVTATIRKVATTYETNIWTSADGRKVVTFHMQMLHSGNTTDYPTVYLSVSGAAITLQKCRLTCQASARI